MPDEPTSQPASESLQIGSPPIDPTWRPPEPPTEPTKDWIRLKSDEWLRGEINSLYRHTLEFESDELDSLSLDWDDIKEVRTNRPFSILRADRTTFTGIVNVIGDRVIIRNEAGEYHTTRANITRLVPGSLHERDHWAAKVSLGATLRSGNTDQLDASSRITLVRRTANSRLDFSFVGAYSEVNDETTADNEKFDGKHDVFIGPRLFITTLSLELFRDPFQNIDLRVVPSTGVGFLVADSNELEWDVNAGFGYRYTRFSSVDDTGDDSDGNANLLFGTSFDSDLTKKLELSFDYDVQMSLEDTQDTNQTTTMILSFDLWKDLDFDLTFVWSRVGLPQRDSDGVLPQKDDFRLSVGLGWEF